METRPPTLDDQLANLRRQALTTYEMNAFDACKKDAAARLRKLRALPRAYHPFKPMRLDKTAETSPRYGNRKRTRPAS